MQTIVIAVPCSTPYDRISYDIAIVDSRPFIIPRRGQGGYVGHVPLPREHWVAITPGELGRLQRQEAEVQMVWLATWAA